MENIKMSRDPIGVRIQDLRKDRRWSQKDLADRLHISKSQISRIESGDTMSVGHDLVIAMALEFQVSTDCLLGLTPMTTQKNHEITELGLSEKVAKRILSNSIDVDVLNRLLEHDRFPFLCKTIRYYFEDVTANGIAARNSIIGLATADYLGLRENVSTNSRAEITEDVNRIRSNKLALHEAEIEKLKETFIWILKDIKKGFEEKDMPGVQLAEDSFHKIQEELSALPQDQITEEDLANAVARLMGATASIPEDQLEQCKQLTQAIIHAVSESNIN